MKPPYAEDLNYWKTGQSSPDTWVDRARGEIRAAGGKPGGDAIASDGQGRAAIWLEFELQGERYRIVWPVLASKTGNQRAARIQAATMLYHDIKARCVAAKVLGARAAFLTFLLLPDGRTAAEASTPELAERYPRLLQAPSE
jgi:hypothetical protein